MELTVYKINGEKTDRSVLLDDAIFGITPNDHAIYLDVKQIMANKRQGTHKSKERGEIAGSTRKLKKQKGTGSARFGGIKILCSEAVVEFLGHNHDYTISN